MKGNNDYKKKIDEVENRCKKQLKKQNLVFGKTSSLIILRRVKQIEGNSKER